MRYELIWEKLAVALNGSSIKVFLGPSNPSLRDYIHQGVDFLYVDNSYFFRGPRSGNFRLIRGALHLTQLLPEQKTRVVAIPELEPWRIDRNRRNIVVIPPNPYHVAIFDAADWLKTTLDSLSRLTHRPVIVKHDKREPLRNFLRDAYAVVTFSSVAGVEAAMCGVPVFSGPYCPSLPISAGALDRIEEPYLGDRTRWMRSLAYASWSVDNAHDINLKDYDYQCV